MADETEPKRTVHIEATNTVGSVSGDARVIGVSINTYEAEQNAPPR